MNYYNEFDPYAAQWLRNLIDAGHLPKGEVDSRSIKDVKASELAGFVQCHFFAGLGGWSHALRLAGWPEDRPVWTGSCPCQPFSAAGAGGASPTSVTSGPLGSISSASADLTLSLVSKLKQRLTTDGSTLFKLTWREKATPAGRLVYRLAASGRRTSDKDSGSWQTPKALDGVFSTPRTTGRPMHRATHLQTQTIALLTNADPTLASWVSPRAQDGERGGEHERGVEMGGGRSTAQRGATGHQLDRTDTTDSQLADGQREGLEGHAGDERNGDEPGRVNAQPLGSVAPSSWVGGLVYTTSLGSEVALFDSSSGHTPTGVGQADVRGGRGAFSPSNGFWSDCDWLPCRDGKARPVEPGTFPLAHGVSGRVGRLRAYGNAIVPQVAQVFVEAYLQQKRTPAQGGGKGVPMAIGSTV